jgi:hypothetical protein
VLRRLFEGFELTTDPAAPSGYSLRPWIRSEHVTAPRLSDGRIDWEAAHRPAVQRVAFDFSDNLCSLLADW